METTEETGRAIALAEVGGGQVNGKRQESQSARQIAERLVLVGGERLTRGA